MPEPRPYCLSDGTPLTLNQARMAIAGGEAVYRMVRVSAGDLGGLGP